MKKYNLKELYSLRQNFIVIGLTGRLGSGCSHATKEILSKDHFNWAPKPELVQPKDNDDRKYKISYNFLESNWNDGFLNIQYSDVIFLMLFREFKQAYTSFDRGFSALTEFVGTLQNDPFAFELINELKLQGITYDNEQAELIKLKDDFKNIYAYLSKNRLFKIFDLGQKGLSENQHKKVFHLFFENEDFQKLKRSFNNALQIENISKRAIVLNVICNYYRSRECIYCEPDSESDFPYVYSVAEVINLLIKTIRVQNSTCKVVIDSLRNPLEIRYFKERFSGFYPIAIHIDDEERIKNITTKCNIKKSSNCCENLIKLDNYESKSIEGHFYMQDVQKCLQLADIHLMNSMEDSGKKKSLSKQMVHYVSLMMHPGLIPASGEERMMQIAYTAKYNSGCISRQVGAAICDANFSIKSIGWNSPPKHQVPCQLRNAQDLIDSKDTVAFSKHESNKSGEIFATINKHYGKEDFKEHNCSFCFKQIQNSLKEGKNQVHTRSLHAEENAMLQITKYGGTGIEGGNLFTTASPCELCAKKAYQLGIKNIYFIDPYPGIASAHILQGGTQNPTLIQFSGAIGKTYFKLYDPYMAHKDEMALRFGIEIVDENKRLKTEQDQLKSRIAELENLVVSVANGETVLEEVIKKDEGDINCCI